MYTIYYIYNNHMDNMKCALKKFLPYCVEGLRTGGAEIIYIKNYRGEIIEY